jgi:FkbM family methyltransferase
MDSAIPSESVRLRFSTRFYNVFRYFFKIPLVESVLLSKILKKPRSILNKFIPPLYLYKRGSIRFVERDHIKYVLDISRLLDHSIFFGLIKEPAWVNLFKNLKRDAIIIDAGANIGYLSLHFARACPAGMVFSFEPDSDNYSNLETNVRLNDFQNIKTFPLALGAKTEKAILFKMYPKNPGANRILPVNSEKLCQREWVDVTTVDEIIENVGISRIDLLKIDVEGYELFVLMGARAAIMKWKPTLFVELIEANFRQQGYTAISLLEYIESLGYEVVDAKTMLKLDRTMTDYHTDLICFSK